MELITCPSCGSLVRRDQIRGFCRVCGKRTCVICMRVCDSCLRIVCPSCIRLRAVWKQNKLYLMKICDYCWKNMLY